MVRWPAIIHYHGEDELTFVLDQEEWRQDPDLYAHTYQEGDILIDSKGRLFLLEYNHKRKLVELKHTKCIVELTKFCEMIRKHLALSDQCCISKLNINSYDKGLELVKDTR